ncbi:MAG: hypothetical protein B7Y49_01850 [Sphingomonas sp. 28-62-11]|nr:MAG: hypothetical protein B7Y49_01850 [Sphingomonas sp. 28-62-11]
MGESESMTTRAQIEAVLRDLDHKEREFEIGIARAEAEFSANMAKGRAEFHAGMAKTRAEFQRMLSELS